MSVKTITSAILRQMSDMNKRRQKILVHLTFLYLSMRGRKNFLMMERYGEYSEQTYRQHFSKPHDFKAFNLELVKRYCGKALAWVFDPSYIHFTQIKKDDEQAVYEGVAHIRCLKRWYKVVIVHTLKENGEVKSAAIYFSTDPQTPGLEALQIYNSRYHIEFLFRDAKGHLGLEDCQSRQGEALDFHFNTTLTTLNVAKAHHWLSIEKEQRHPFSIADIKTQYINELMLDRLICIYGKCPSVEKNKPEIQKLYQLGRIAA